MVQVVIESELSEIGTVGLYCVDSNRGIVGGWSSIFAARWKRIVKRTMPKENRRESLIRETVDQCGNAIVAFLAESTNADALRAKQTRQRNSIHRLS